MPRNPVIAIVGTGQEVEPAVTNARELGRRIADNGWILVTGGRDAGVMRAANEGAKSAKESLTIGILPYSQTDVSDAVDVAIVTDTGEARNNIIVLTADAVIACGVDDPGTASEVALAIKNGTPVVLVAASDETSRFFLSISSGSVQVASDAKEAIDILTKTLS